MLHGEEDKIDSLSDHDNFHDRLFDIPKHANALGGVSPRQDVIPMENSSVLGQDLLDQLETEDSLNFLIDELDAEDGKEPDPDAASIHPGHVFEVPYSWLDTSLEDGLNSDEVILRRKKYGWNMMKEAKRNHVLKFLSFFMGPVQWVMEVRDSSLIHTVWSGTRVPIIFFSLQAAVILAGGLQDWIDFGIICGLLVLNAVVGFVQEYHAGNIVDDLKKTLALRAQVIRDGTLKEINSAEVVVGDVLQLRDVGQLAPR
jgi:H+-transporting ATPase